MLDCHDVDATVASLAGAIEIRDADLERALGEYDEARFDDHSEDPWARMPREVLERFGVSVDGVASRFDGAYYFHGTRVVDPEEFRRHGILPLDMMIANLWRTLRDLVREALTDEEWDAFRMSVASNAGGHDGWLYRHKTTAGVGEGPFGLLVREIFLNPEATGSHDYLGCPEIVQDISRCLHSSHGVDLEQRFCAASKPCIVKFRSGELRPGAINAALWYAYSKLRATAS